MEKTVKRNVWSRTPIVVLTAAFCCLLWGSAAPCIKIGYSLFCVTADDVPAIILFAGLRFTIAGLMVLAAGSLIEHRLLLPKKSSWKGIFTLAALQTVIQYILFYNGVAHTSGVRCSIINACGTFFSIAVSVLFFHFEKLTPAKVIGSIAGFLGVLLIVTNGEDISGEPFAMAGEGLLIISTLSSAFAGCAIKLFSKDEDPVLLSGWQFFCGGLCMMGIGAIGGGRLIPTAASCIPLILYMGFISAGAYTFWGILLKYNEVSKVTICGFMNPVFGVIISAILLGEFSEAANIYALAALLLVVAGIVIVNRPGKAANAG
ncbi:MAG: DMT family transporter [Lachnospiraceae bacterium]|nr:DMT family transporter [Lachnospiraceae bacterium]